MTRHLVVPLSIILEALGRPSLWLAYHTGTFWNCHPYRRYKDESSMRAMEYVQDDPHY